MGIEKRTNYDSISMLVQVPTRSQAPFRDTRSCPCHHLPKVKVFLAHTYPNLGESHQPPIEIGLVQVASVKER